MDDPLFLLNKTFNTGLKVGPQERTPYFPGYDSQSYQFKVQFSQAILPKSKMSLEEDT